MTASRLRELPARDAGGESPGVVQFTFDGRELIGIRGEPLAASLLASGQAILSRSFRFHRPRGLMCSTGQCGWCECEVDGRPSVRTCRVAVEEGMVVRGEHALPSVDRDALSLLDLVSRLVPPTFYHHRFRHPRQLRKAYLDVLRWFGGRGRLRPGGSKAAGHRDLRVLTTDVLVVGAGRAGILAANAAAESGAAVLVLEADPGEFWESPAERLGEAWTEPLPRPEVTLRLGVAVVGWYEGRIAAVDGSSVLDIEAGVVVAATGSYERVPSVVGADRPGVMSARLVRRLVRRDGILPAARPVLVGDVAELASLSAELARVGARPAGPYPTAALARIDGRRGVSAARLRTDAGEIRVPADAIVFGDRVPAIDLLLAAGAAVDWQADHFAPAVDEAGRTSVEGLIAAGSAAGRPGDDVAARAAGRAAADAAARRSRDRGASEPASRAAAPGGETSGSVSHAASGSAAATMICFCEDVRVGELAAECRAGYRDPELLKRRTGALTGPCQGKYCLNGVAAACGGDAWLPPTSRPPLRPIRLGDLAGPAPGSDVGSERA